MFSGNDWISDWRKAEVLSLRMGEISAAVPLRGSWEPDDRIALAMASFRLAQEHHGSIHLLFSKGKNASARALVRPVIEAALRVIWLLEDASHSEITAIVKGRELPILGTLKDCLSKRGEPLGGKSEGLLHSLTHGGMTALAAQFLEGDQLARSNASMVTMAGITLGSAGYTLCRKLGHQDLLDQFNAATPNFD